MTPAPSINNKSYYQNNLIPAEYSPKRNVKTFPQYSTFYWTLYFAMARLHEEGGHQWGIGDQGLSLDERHDDQRVKTKSPG